MTLRKIAVLSSIILFAVCGPALAAYAVPPAPPGKTLDFTMELKDGNAISRYDMLLDVNQCGEIAETGDHGSQQVEICAADQPGGVHLRVKWETHRGVATFKATASSIVVPGKPFTIGRELGQHLSITVK